MPLLFSYGTLQQEAVQVGTFGRLLEGEKDALAGYEPSLVPIDDPDVVAATGRTHHANASFTGRDESRVNGTVFEITQGELEAADEYERRAAYSRVAVTLASGKRAWVYVAADSAPRPLAVLVRDVVPADAAAVVGILNPIIEARVYTVFDTPLSVDAERAYIAGFPTRGVWKVAERTDGRVVGFQVLEPFATYTGAFDHVATLGTYVDLAQRRQGVARTLFAATFEAARQKQFEKILTFVRADNAAALATYLAQGFGVVGTARKHARIDGHYVDEIMIEKIGLP